MAGTLQMLDKLNTLTALSVSDALVEIEKLKNDPDATPRNLAAYLMGIDVDRVQWGDLWPVPSAVLQLMWDKRDDNPLVTLLWMLDAYLSDSTIQLAFYEVNLEGTPFADVMRELTMEQRALAALYVLDRGQCRIEEGKDGVDGVMVGAPTYAMVAGEFLSDEHAHFPVEDLVAEEKIAAFKVLGMGFEMIMSENKTLTLNDLKGTIKLIFGIDVPNPQKLAKAA